MCVYVCVCVYVTCHCVVEFFCISLLRRALCVDTIYCTRQLLRQLLAFLLFQLTSFARPQLAALSLRPSLLVCHLFGLGAIIKLQVYRLLLRLLVSHICFRMQLDAARISMCKLIKASKTKLKHFAPAAHGNSIQFNRLAGNKSHSHLPFIRAT